MWTGTRIRRVVWIQPKRWMFLSGRSDAQWMEILPKCRKCWVGACLLGCYKAEKKLYIISLHFCNLLEEHDYFPNYEIIFCNFLPKIMPPGVISGCLFKLILRKILGIIWKYFSLVFVDNFFRVICGHIGVFQRCTDTITERKKWRKPPYFF